jgi:thiamine pyrophosphate-dependent acetolactate synthase large subunit-like protein
MSGGLDRRVVVTTLMKGRGNLLVVSGLGASTYDLAAAGDHDRNFYLWGAMGGAASMGLGLALARPDLPVLVLTGDGEMLMGLGSLATIGARKPRNLSIVVLDNGLYAETGGQTSHTAIGVNLAAIARGCGIADARNIARQAELPALAERLHCIGEGPCFAVIFIAAGDAPKVLPSRDGAFLRARFRRAVVGD